jgi:hypothetical protein
MSTASLFHNSWIVQPTLGRLAQSEGAGPRALHDQQKVIQVWLDPQRKSAEVIAPDRPAQHFRAAQVLTFPELPDFRLDFNNLFA